MASDFNSKIFSVLVLGYFLCSFRLICLMLLKCLKKMLEKMQLFKGKLELVIKVGDHFECQKDVRKDSMSAGKGTLVC